MPNPAPIASVESLFEQALDVAVADRETWLREQTQGDKALIRAVSTLLEASARAGGFLEGTRSEPEAPAPRRIGVYELMAELGRGGSGTVYRARQEEPVRREVALKWLNAGLESPERLARFGAERHVLASMEHDNIARVFDAGVSEEGRPFFVMELVRGEPITRFCDQHRMSLRERIALFIEVCRAVHHAHQKGVIHRDLKPSNILVAESDGRSVAKVIDFGIAKLTAVDNGEDLVHTHETTMLGTPAYMGPEQFGLRTQVIDTRTDIFALGAVLFELLTSVPPRDPKIFQQLHPAVWAERVRQATGEAPSRAVASFSEEKTTAGAAARGAAASQWASNLRGDLDWIVLRCLETEPARRYGSAEALAADLGRFLAHQPIEARPPDRLYLAGKFLRRHRTGAAAAGLAFLGLAGGLGLSLSSREVAHEARQRAESEWHRAEAEAVAAKAEKEKAEAIVGSLYAGLFASKPQLADPTPENMSRALKQLADGFPSSLRKDPVTERRLRHLLGFALCSVGAHEEAGPQLERALVLCQKNPGPASLDAARLHYLLGRVSAEAGDASTAREHYDQALAIPAMGASPEDSFGNHVRLAVSALEEAEGREAESLAFVHQALKVVEERRAELPATDGSEGRALELLLQHHRKARRWPEAVAAAQARVQWALAHRGAESPTTWAAQADLANADLEVGRLEEAIDLLTQARTRLKRSGRERQRLYWDVVQKLGEVHLRAGNWKEAAAHFERILELRKTEQTMGEFRAVRAEQGLKRAREGQTATDRGPGPGPN